MSHLWQSTVFAGVVWLLTLAFKRNRAAVRYWLWLAASVKFLIPFSVLSQVGSRWAWRTVVVDFPPSPMLVQHASTVPAAAATGGAAPVSPDLLPLLLPAVWILGIVIGAMYWLRAWLRLRAAVRSATPLQWNAGIPVLSTCLRLEPGVFGIRRPVLLVPEGFSENLTDAQRAAILAHELCHYRRRDNLTAAIHMLVETVFWFHPLVWWIRMRLVEERERACDEAVLEGSADPRTYAEGILNVCRMYARAPVCAAGVSGANLKKRIEEIMSRRISRDVGVAQKLLLAAAGAGAIALPLLVGLLGVREVRAQAQPRLAFEVTSVRENKSPDRRSSRLQFLPGGKLVAKNVPLMMVIVTAYDLPFQSDRLSGGPDWVRNGVFDIEATAGEEVIPAGTPQKVLDEKLRLMLQSLLADRFKMVIRREIKDRPVYAITVAKNGPKLERGKTEEQDCTPDTHCHSLSGGQGRGLHGDSVSLSDVATFVSNWSDRPVIDKTGLAGLYNIQTSGWSPMRQRTPRPAGEPASDEDRFFEDPATPTMFQIFGQLGLALDSQKAPVEMFTIVSAEKPEEN